MDRKTKRKVITIASGAAALSCIAFVIKFVGPAFATPTNPIEALRKASPAFSEDWRVPVPLDNVSVVGLNVTGQPTGDTVQTGGARCFYTFEDGPTNPTKGVSTLVTYSTTAKLLQQFSRLKFDGDGDIRSSVMLDHCFTRSNLGPPDWEGGCFPDMSANTDDASMEVTAISEEVVARNVTVALDSKVDIKSPPTGAWSSDGGTNVRGESVVIAARVRKFAIRTRVKAYDLGREPNAVIGRSFEIPGSLDLSLVVSDYDGAHQRLEVLIQTAGEPGSAAHWQATNLKDLHRVNCMTGEKNWISITEQCVDIIDKGTAVVIVTLRKTDAGYRLDVRRTSRSPVAATNSK